MFEKEGLLIFGPNKAAAQMEASKSFAKDIMKLNIVFEYAISGLSNIINECTNGKK